MNNSVPAIPTLYRGYRFRSRTEARWAALFDLIGWRWEYEPFDAAGYIPDFAILGPEQFLVEVKPDLSLTALARHTMRIQVALRGTWSHDVLVVGSTPFPHPDDRDSQFWDQPAAGLLGEYNEEYIEGSKEIWWNWDAGIWNRCGNRECGQTAVFHCIMSYTCRPCGCYSGDSYVSSYTRPGEERINQKLERAWAEATNRAQWKPIKK